MTVNIVLRNFIISMATVIIGGLVLWASESQSEGGVSIPWLLLVGFAGGCLVLSFVTWWKRRAMPKDAKGPDGRKGRGK
jgi:hypothetical protein